MAQLLGAGSRGVNDKRLTVQAMDNPNDPDFRIGRNAKVGQDRVKKTMALLLNGVEAAPWRKL